MGKAKETTDVEGMGVGSHLGMLAFPILAVGYCALLLGPCARMDLSRNVLLFAAVTSVLILVALAVIGWRFLRDNPAAGVFYSSALFFMIPITQQATDVPLLKLLFGAAAAVGGGAGILYFFIVGLAALKSE